MFDEAIKLNLIIAEMRSGNLNKMAAPSADFFFFWSGQQYVIVCGPNRQLVARAGH